MQRKFTRILLTLGIALACIQAPMAKPAKTILDYYKALKGKLGIDKSYKIVKKDIANGFLSVMSSPGLGSAHIDMALWRSRAGKEIVGVFSYGCGGMGCWGKFNDFKFFDANLREVRTEVLDWAKLKQIHDKSVPEGSIEAGFPTVTITIPQRGTTIKIVGGLMGGDPKPIANLYYNMNNGRFTIK